MSEEVTPPIFPSFIMDAVAEVDRLMRFGRMVDLGFMLGSSLSTILDLYEKRLSGDAVAAEAIEGLRPLAAELQPYAAVESKNRLPYLKSLTTIRLVAIMEVVVQDAVVLSLESVSKVLDRDEVRRIKGPVIELASASPYERAEFIANALALEMKTPMRSGVGKFEALLKPVGLDGAVDDLARTALFELLNVRNVLAHRGGRVDVRFTRNCPWLTQTVGTELRITPEMTERYKNAVVYYLIELLIRWLRRDGNITDIASFEELRENALQKLR